MTLPENFRSQIADRLVRSVAPATILIMVVNSLGFFILGNHQYYRMVPTAVLLILLPPAWILALRGKPILGAAVLMFALNAAVIGGMIFGGGVFAPSYIGVIAIVTVFAVLFGLKKSIIYILGVIAAGGLFVILDGAGLIMKADALSSSYYLFTLGIFFCCQLFFVSVPIKLLFKAFSDEQKTAAELDGILKRTPNIIFKTDPSGQIEFISHAVSKYGYRTDQLIGSDIRQFIHSEDKGTAEKILHGHTGGSFRMELAHGQKDHEDSKKHPINTFITTMEAIREEEKGLENIMGFQGIARDITKEKAYEEQLQRFAAVIEQADEEVLIYDREGTIQYVNPSFEKNSGWTRDRLLYTKITRLKEAAPHETFYDKIGSALSSLQAWQGRIEDKSSTAKTILYDVTITPITDDKGQISAFFALRRDVTQKAKAEQHLQQVQKMEAIGTLAGGIAHDFNNILGAVMGYAELVKKGLPEGSAARSRQQQVITASVRAKELVEQILLFSRQSDQVIKAVQPHLIIREALKLLRASIPSTIEIKQHVPTNLGSIVADATQIHQIVMNLCTNAYHAMREEGGLLSVTLSKADIREDDITFSKLALKSGEYLMLEVSDTGHGMDQETMKSIFDPYFTTKSKGEGTGLGLAVVHGIVKSCNGHIQTYSEPGKGTCFRIYFPRVEAPTDDVEQNQDTVLPTGDETILVVDDDPSILEMMQLSLESLGYRVFSFSSSGEALLELQTNAKKFDLVITDMTMPKITGLELARQLLETAPDMPIILCTGFSENLSREKAEAMGIKGFLMKPVLRKNLAAAIRSALDHQETEN